jgi:CRP-like cAMP-binding protein
MRQNAVIYTNVKELKARDTELLSESFLFIGITKDTMLSICSGDGCQLSSFTKGDIVYSPESFKKSCGLILTGSLKVTKASCGGQELLMNILKRGSLFGAAALWDGHEGYVTSLTAAEKCRVVLFSQELLESAIKKEPVLALNYIRFLTGRVCFLNDKIQSLIAGRSGSTLAQYLEACTERLGASFQLEIGLTELAAALNISRASLYRAFDALESENAVKRNGRSIEILNYEKLRSFSQ